MNSETLQRSVRESILAEIGDRHQTAKTEKGATSRRTPRFLDLEVHFDNDIVKVSVATAIHIFHPEGVVTQEAEMIYLVWVGTDVVKVGMNDIGSTTIGIVIVEEAIQVPLGNDYRGVDCATSQVFAREGIVFVGLNAIIQSHSDGLFSVVGIAGFEDVAIG
jgi:hypothetical protein